MKSTVQRSARFPTIARLNVVECFEVNVTQSANFKTKLFTVTVSVIGTLALLYSIYHLSLAPVRLDWMLVLAFTMLLSWRAEVWIPGVRSKITLTDIFICIAI